MDPEQKKYILENYTKRSIEQMAHHLNLKERKIKKFLDREKDELKVLKSAGALQKTYPIPIFSLPLLLGIIILGFLIYSNTFQASFHLDDESSIVQNQTIRNLWDWPSLWDYSRTRFLTYGSFALNFSLGGLDVFGYHFFNILIHMTCSLLVYFLVYLTFRAKQASETASVPSPPGKTKLFPSLSPQWIASAASLIFLTHPIQTQAVTYISQRAALLAALFYLASLFLYIKARLEERRLYYFLAFFTTLLAMLTKEITFTLPLALLLYEVLIFGNFFTDFKKKCLRLLPFLLTLTIIPILVMLSRQPTAAQPLQDFTKETISLSRSSYLLTQINVLRTYLRLLFFPVSQNLDYDYPISHSLLEPATLLSLTLLIGILAAALILVKKQKLISFSIFWFFLTLSVESGLIPIQDVIFEHRLYLPMLGFSLLTPIGLCLFLKNKREWTAACGIIIALFSVLTYQRNFVWRNELTLWQDVAKKSPQKARAYNTLGVIYGERGQKNKEIKFLEKAIQLDPNHAEAYYNLGVVYGEKGDFEKAKAFYEKAIQAKSDYVYAYDNLAVLYAERGNLSKGIELWQKIIEIEPTYFPAYNNLGTAYSKIANDDKAIEMFEKAIALNPYYTDAYENLSSVYERKEDFEKAIEVLKEAIRMNPSQAPKLEPKIKALQIKPLVDNASENLTPP